MTNRASPQLPFAPPGKIKYTLAGKRVRDFFAFLSKILFSPVMEAPMITVKVNGKDYDIDVPPDKPLLWVIREDLGLTAPNSVAVWPSAAPAQCT
jgi:predicted lysophospholipase L1 biosynthesis ABC-type transport system permease subunit